MCISVLSRKTDCNDGHHLLGLFHAGVGRVGHAPEGISRLHGPRDGRGAGGINNVWPIKRSSDATQHNDDSTAVCSVVLFCSAAAARIATFFVCDRVF